MKFGRSEQCSGPCAHFPWQVNNLSLLYLNEPNLLHNIKERFEERAIYTYTGQLELLAINPYEVKYAPSESPKLPLRASTSANLRTASSLRSTSAHFLPTCRLQDIDGLYAPAVMTKYAGASTQADRLSVKQLVSS